MLGAVTLLRLRLRTAQARDAAVVQTWQPLLAQCLHRCPGVLPVLAAIDRPTFLRLWIRTQEALRGEAGLALNELARRLDMEAVALAMLDSHDLRLQMLALAALGHLRGAATARAVRERVDAARPWLSLAAAEAWVRIDEGDALPALLRRAAQREDWSIAKVAFLLRGASAEPMSKALSAAIVDRLPPAAPQGLVRLLKLAAVAHVGRVHAAVLQVFECSEDPEAIGAALALLQLPGDVEPARRHCLHPHWHVRMEAVRALGRIGTQADLYLLVRSLGDAHWWVRCRAAQALVRSSWMNAAELDRIAAGLRDRFALDILREARAEAA